MAHQAGKPAQVLLPRAKTEEVDKIKERFHCPHFEKMCGYGDKHDLWEAEAMEAPGEDKRWCDDELLEEELHTSHDESAEVKQKKHENTEKWLKEVVDAATMRHGWHREVPACMWGQIEFARKKLEEWKALAAAQADKERDPKLLLKILHPAREECARMLGLPYEAGARQPATPVVRTLPMQPIAFAPPRSRLPRAQERVKTRAFMEDKWQYVPRDDPSLMREGRFIAYLLHHEAYQIVDISKFAHTLNDMLDSAEMHFLFSNFAVCLGERNPRKFMRTLMAALTDPSVWFRARKPTVPVEMTHTRFVKACAGREGRKEFVDIGAVSDGQYESEPIDDLSAENLAKLIDPRGDEADPVAVNYYDPGMIYKVQAFACRRFVHGMQLHDHRPIHLYTRISRWMPIHTEWVRPKLTRLLHRPTDVITDLDVLMHWVQREYTGVANKSAAPLADYFHLAFRDDWSKQFFRKSHTDRRFEMWNFSRMLPRGQLVCLHILEWSASGKPSVFSVADYYAKLQSANRKNRDKWECPVYSEEDPGCIFTRADALGDIVNTRCVTVNQLPKTKKKRGEPRQFCQPAKPWTALRDDHWRNAVAVPDALLCALCALRFGVVVTDPKQALECLFLLFTTVKAYAMLLRSGNRPNEVCTKALADIDDLFRKTFQNDIRVGTRGMPHYLKFDEVYYFREEMKGPHDNPQEPGRFREAFDPCSKFDARNRSKEIADAQRVSESTREDGRWAQHTTSYWLRWERFEYECKGFSRLYDIIEAMQVAFESDVVAPSAPRPVAAAAAAAASRSRKKKVKETAATEYDYGVKKRTMLLGCCLEAGNTEETILRHWRLCGYGMPRPAPSRNLYWTEAELLERVYLPREKYGCYETRYTDERLVEMGVVAGFSQKHVCARATPLPDWSIASPILSAVVATQSFFVDSVADMHVPIGDGDEIQLVEAYQARPPCAPPKASEPHKFNTLAERFEHMIQKQMRLMRPLSVEKPPTVWRDDLLHPSYESQHDHLMLVLERMFYTEGMTDIEVEMMKQDMIAIDLVTRSTREKCDKQIVAKFNALVRESRPERMEVVCELVYRYFSITVSSFMTHETRRLRFLTVFGRIVDHVLGMCVDNKMPRKSERRIVDWFTECLFDPKHGRPKFASLLTLVLDCYRHLSTHKEEIDAHMCSRVWLAAVRYLIPDGKEDTKFAEAFWTSDEFSDERRDEFLGIIAKAYTREQGMRRFGAPAPPRVEPLPPEPRYVAAVRGNPAELCVHVAHEFTIDADASLELSALWSHALCVSASGDIRQVPLSAVALLSLKYWEGTPLEWVRLHRGFRALFMEWFPTLFVFCRLGADILGKCACPPDEFWTTVREAGSMDTDWEHQNYAWELCDVDLGDADVYTCPLEEYDGPWPVPKCKTHRPRLTPSPLIAVLEDLLHDIMRRIRKESVTNIEWSLRPLVTAFLAAATDPVQEFRELAVATWHRLNLTRVKDEKVEYGYSWREVYATMRVLFSDATTEKLWNDELAEKLNEFNRYPDGKTPPPLSPCVVVLPITVVSEAARVAPRPRPRGRRPSAARRVRKRPFALQSLAQDARKRARSVAASFQTDWEDSAVPETGSSAAAIQQEQGLSESATAEDPATAGCAADTRSGRLLVRARLRGRAKKR